MTATNEREFLAAEEYLNIIGAKKQSDDGFNSKWVLGQVEYTIARAY